MGKYKNPKQRSFVMKFVMSLTISRDINFTGLQRDNKLGIILGRRPETVPHDLFHCDF